MHFDLQSAYFLCLSDLQSAYQTTFGLFLMFFIRKLRLAYRDCIGFTHGEYHVIRVDFIVALRRTKGRGRRTLRSPPSPSSGLHLIHPGLSAAAGKCRLPRLTGISDSGIRCRFLIPTSIYRLGALCSGCGRLRFSRGAQLGAFVFHYWGMDCSFLRLRGVLL